MEGGSDYSPIDPNRSLQKSISNDVGSQGRLGRITGALRRWTGADKMGVRGNEVEGQKERLSGELVRKVLADMKTDGIAILSSGGTNTNYHEVSKGGGLWYRSGDKPVRVSLIAQKSTLKGVPSRQAIHLDFWRYANDADAEEEKMETQGWIIQERSPKQPGYKGGFKYQETGSVNANKRVQKPSSELGETSTESIDFMQPHELIAFLTELKDASVDVEATRNEFDRRHTEYEKDPKISDVYWFKDRPDEAVASF